MRVSTLTMKQHHRCYYHHVKFLLLIVTCRSIINFTMNHHCLAFTLITTTSSTNKYSTSFLKRYHVLQRRSPNKVNSSFSSVSNSQSQFQLYNKSEDDSNTSSNDDDNHNNSTKKNCHKESKKGKEDEYENNPNLLTYEELLRDPEYSVKEYNKSRQRRNSLFLIQDIGRAFNALLWTFVISSLVLQSIGYGFVVIPDNNQDFSTSTGYRLGKSNIKIDTLENKAFLLEMNGKDDQAEKIRRKYLKNYNDL